MQKPIHGVLIPEEVTPFFLVEIPVTSSPLVSKLQTLQREYLQKSPVVLWRRISTLLTAAIQLQADHLAGLLQFLQADLLYRQGELAAALTMTETAQAKLALQVPHLARYHEALAGYFAGLLYYLNRQPAAYPLLMEAVQSLNAVQAFWNYRGGDPKVSRCQQLLFWINDLLALHDEFYQTQDRLIVPLYEKNLAAKVELVGATSVTQREMLPSTETDTAPRLPSGVIRKESPVWYYFALKVHPAAQFQSRNDLGASLLARSSPEYVYWAATPQTATEFLRDARGKIAPVIPTRPSYHVTIGGENAHEY
ncbi:MAG TPA: hypothetical protein G4N98_00180 [Thermoflexia bacterium]|nr:hypothetical protein [Thermoflexia bacterium]